MSYSPKLKPTEIITTYQTSHVWMTYTIYIKHVGITNAIANKLNFIWNRICYSATLLIKNNLKTFITQLAYS